ncbi:hypothetical protein EV426DRAFT_720697 [Tirmania nivea]|nr:hypothetical protein EV426DRAFT_720697 [Tirmania nivea]
MYGAGWQDPSMEVSWPDRFAGDAGTFAYASYYANTAPYACIYTAKPLFPNRKEEKTFVSDLRRRCSVPFRNHGDLSIGRPIDKWGAIYSWGAPLSNGDVSDFAVWRRKLGEHDLDMTCRVCGEYEETGSHVALVCPEGE